MKTNLLLSIGILFITVSVSAQTTITPNTPAVLKNGATLGNTQITVPGTMRFTGANYEVFKDNKWNQLVLTEATSNFEPPTTLWVSASVAEPCQKTCPERYAAMSDPNNYVCIDTRLVAGSHQAMAMINYGGFSQLGWHCVTPSGTYPLSRCYCVRLR